MLEETETQEEYDKLYYLFRANGEFPPSRWQEWALMAIFWILIFELYILYFWLDNFILVWQPEWIQAMAQWIIDHTNQKGFDFVFEPPDSRQGKTWQVWQAEMQAILNTPKGRSMAAFQGWILFSYPIVIACMYKILWHSLDWLGFDSVNPRNIHSFGKLIWMSFVSILMLAVVVLPTLYLFHIDEEVSAKFEAVLYRIHMPELVMYLMFAFLHILAVKYFTGWFQFWRRVLFKKRF